MENNPTEPGSGTAEEKEKLSIIGTLGEVVTVTVEIGTVEMKPINDLVGGAFTETLVNTPPGSSVTVAVPFDPESAQKVHSTSKPAASVFAGRSMENPG